MQNLATFSDFHSFFIGSFGNIFARTHSNFVFFPINPLSHFPVNTPNGFAPPWEMAFGIFHGTVFMSGRCMTTDLFDGVVWCIVIYTHSHATDEKLHLFENLSPVK